MNVLRHANFRRVNTLNVTVQVHHLYSRSIIAVASKDERNVDPSPGIEKGRRPAPALSETVRALMRMQPHSLAAVVAPSDPPTTRTKELPDSRSALLVSSFNTVTLSPIPYVSFNIKIPSRTYANISAFGQFTVSGLSVSATAQAFVNKLEGRGGEDERAAWRKFVGQTGEVRPEYGGTWWLRCKMDKKLSTKVEDHLIVVGEVLEAGTDWTTGGKLDQELSRGLVYVDGQYRHVGGHASTVFDYPTATDNAERKDDLIGKN